MQLLDFSFDSPEENLACDEALLEECESGNGSGVLQDGVIRFWESSRYFVVVGYTGKLAEEANLKRCREMGIPVLRRCSGGGTVVQGPGCLNYSLVARIPEGQSLTGITQTNCDVMQAQARALSQVLSTPAKIRGYTDLAIIDSARGELKFSGNAQRRKRNFFLFHGTFLLDFDLSLIPRVLREPKLQPEYRAQRSHAEFITNLNIPAQSVKDALASEWNAAGVLQLPRARIADLVTEKYSRSEWNEKF